MRKMVREAIIYKITNLLNSKVYIGKRFWNSKRFFSTDYYGSGKYIKRAINKYGKENFKREVLFESDNFLIDKKEKEFIKLYNSLVPYGYNIGLGGEGDNGGQNKGKKWTKEHKLKIGLSRKGKMMGDLSPMRRPEVRMKLMGHIVSEETRDKIRKKHLGIKNTKKHNINVGLGMKKLYANGYINNRKGWKKIGGKWYGP